MSDPKAVTFYFEGDLPAHVSFFSTDGMEETFELKRQFSVSNPQHVAICEQLAANPYHPLSKSAPKKEASS